MGKIDLKTKCSANSSYEAFSILLGANRHREIQELPIDSLVPFANQPFRPYPPERLQLLADDIAQNGVLSPILVRFISKEQYEILAGHNRVRACQSNGMQTIPAIVMAADDNQAVLIMLNTNLNQREELLPSEKAFAYQMQLETMKRKAGRPSTINSRPVGENLFSVDELAQNNPDSARQIHRYIRLTFLISPLLEQVDQKSIAVRAGVSLSYLSQEQQERLLAYIRAFKLSITLEQAERLKGLCTFGGELLISHLDSVFGRSPKAPPAKVKAASSSFRKAYRTAAPRLEGFFTGKDEKEITAILIDALEAYFNITTTRKTERRNL